MQKSSPVAQVSSAGPTPAMQTRKKVTIVSKQSEKCLTVKDGKYANNTRLVMSTCDKSGKHQTFSTEKSGEIKISGKCVTATGTAAQNNDLIILWDCVKQVNQIWGLNARNEIQGNGKCITIWNADKADGTATALWDCAGYDNAAWKIVP